jgi:hypothetical protein
MWPSQVEKMMICCSKKPS